MNEKVIRKSRRYGQLIFVAAVTGWLLAFVFIEASKGLAGLPAFVLFALAAGFGLEFVSAAWTGRWKESVHRSSLHR